MDVMMPVMDGIEATMEIRKFNKELAIIAIAPVGF
jgi:CheY-like chemotaxis protein